MYKTAAHSTRALNWLNFFAADVATGVGPFLAVYLAGNLHWTPGPVGLALSTMSFATVLFQTPAGYLLDRIRHERVMIVGASVVMGVMSMGILLFPTEEFIITSQVGMGMAAAVYTPALIALASGLCGAVKADRTIAAGFDRTIAANQMYNHAGNVAAALLIGILGLYTNNKGVFYCLMVLSVLCCVSALSIRPTDLKDPRSGRAPAQPAAPGKHPNSRPWIIFLSASFIFHFANAAMLPLVGQEIGRRTDGAGSLYMSVCIIIAQLVMVPVTWLCGSKVQRGRKKLLLMAFTVLPIRGILYTLCVHPWYLTAIQVLDGIGAGIFSVVSILMASDLTENPGKASYAQGLLATAVGLGASLSNVVTGYLVDRAGFNAGFLALSGLAAAALALLWIAMPETKTGHPV